MRALPKPVWPGNNAPPIITFMCGRARLSSDVSEIRIAFRIPPERPTPNVAPSWNVAPTDPLPVVRYQAKDCQRSLKVMVSGTNGKAGIGRGCMA
jgi:putative SOS response-associated peptidase YedK